MKIAKDEFRRLQQEWYKRLADEGFKDIEKPHGEDFILLQTAGYCFRETDSFAKEMKEEYFRCVSQMAEDPDTDFRNDIDRHILRRHAEGAKIKVIIQELDSMDMSRTRESVRTIIRRYEMAWGLRQYTDRMLRKYK
jgi:hypothetical protein